MILIPEHPFDLERVRREIRRRHAEGRRFSIVVVCRGRGPGRGTMEVPDYPLDQRWPQARGHRQPRRAAALERMTGSSDAGHRARSRPARRVARSPPTASSRPRFGRSRPSTLARGWLGPRWWAAAVRTSSTSRSSTAAKVRRRAGGAASASCGDVLIAMSRRSLGMKRRGILTGGGDVPGLNAVHQGRRRSRGARRGPRGRRDPARVGRAAGDRPRRSRDDRLRTRMPLDPGVVRTIDRTGGTFLHTSRTNPAKVRPPRSRRS